LLPLNNLLSRLYLKPWVDKDFRIKNAQDYVFIHQDAEKS